MIGCARLAPGGTHLISNSTAAGTAVTALPPNAAQLLRISRRYAGRWLQGYAHGKLRSDPVYRAAATEIAAHPAPVLDIGCGIGLLAHYLHAVGCRVPYLGVDIDARKIQAALHAMGNQPKTRFEQTSCATLGPWQGHVAILDVLHYLDNNAQYDLLRVAAVRVAPGAALIVRTVLRDRSWRFAVTRAEEFFFSTRTGFVTAYGAIRVWKHCMPHWTIPGLPYTRRHCSVAPPSTVICWSRAVSQRHRNARSG